MVEIKNLTKFYGDHAAVQDISFSVGDHEVLGFLGPNGAGKSTTMNMITGCLPSTSGTVLVDGYDIEKDPMEVKRRIGYLPELPPVYPDMRVRDYLMFAAGLKGVKKPDRKKQVDNAMERLRITDVQKRIIGNLSKGYRQRVGFAQALLGQPKFLILDEPTVGLDPTQVMEVRKLIQDLAKDHTIIFSTHILSEVTAVCERVVIINKGKIRAIDTIAHLEESSGADKVFKVRIEGSMIAVSDILNSIEGVRSVDDVTVYDAVSNVYTVTAENEDVRKRIMKTMVEHDFMVLEMTDVHSSLEDVFVKLTQEKKTDPFEELGKEMDAAREAEEAAKQAADDAAEDSETDADTEKKEDDD